MSPRKNSFLTVTDQFCGAGGSSLGASAAGLEIRMALNHWDLAVETHQTNFPNADHDCADISATDPRRYPSTDILITSPECTTHSPAGGNRHRKSSQRDLFVATENDPETVRSRATMWDVVRFTEYHGYRAIIVENVVEVIRYWVLFPIWWKAMENLGYHGQIVCLNSQFAIFDGMTTPFAPQSRDRLYIVWTRDRRRKPDLRIEPLAPCLKCGNVEGRQTWRVDRKGQRTSGKYGDRNQYWYTCPTCRGVVQPYYFCALNAIDFSIPATRIGDRKEPLKPNTLARVHYGFERFGRRPLQVTTNNISGVACRVRGADEALFGQTGSLTTALVSPWLVNAGSNDFRTRSATDPAPAVTGSERVGLAGIDPFLYVARENVKAKSLLDAGPAMVASANQVGIVSDKPTFTPFISVARTNSVGAAMDGVVPAMTTGRHHILIQPSALVRLMGDRPVKPLDAVVPAQTGGADQNMIISPSPYLIQYYGSDNASSVDEAVPAISTKDRHALVGGGLDVNDCYFRMFAVSEVQATMAFHPGYVIKGTKGKQIKQLGNAVTPPAMELLIQRVVQFLAGTRSLPVRSA